MKIEQSRYGVFRTGSAVYVSFFVSPQLQLPLLPHVFAWGQPMQVCPRFFAR